MPRPDDRSIPAPPPPPAGEAGEGRAASRARHPSSATPGRDRPPIGLRPFDRLPSIRAKLGAVIVFAVAATILIMYVTLGFALRSLDQYRQSQELADETRGVAAFALNENGAPSRAFLRAVGSRPSTVVVVDAFGRVVYHQGDLAPPPTVAKALAGYPDSGRVGRVEYFGVPIVRQGVIVGAIYLTHAVEGGGLAGAVAATWDFMKRVWWQLLLAGAIAAIIALLLARYLARGLTQPLRDMSQAARQMAQGDYRQRVEGGSRDEVGQLAEAFNRMAGEMEGLEKLRRELVANVSHELKTPISALRAHLENLLDGVEQPNPATLQVMLEQSERLGRLVEQLLDLSRLESGEVPLSLQALELDPLVQRVLAEVTVARPDRAIEIRTDIPAGLPPVAADPERLHQVLYNLLDNAFRFTPAGGRVTVSAIRGATECEVRVEDTGPGIPEEHLGLVFERFYRVDEARSRDDGGTGIGLAIARSVVEAHGGRIWAERAPRGGARLRFVLPVARPEGRDDSATPSGTPVGSRVGG